MTQPLSNRANGSASALSPILTRGRGRGAKAGLLAAALATTIAPAALHAQVDQTWVGGESNVWSTGALNWDTGAGWTNGNNAIFGGTWDLIDIEGAVNVDNITFDTDGYIIGDTDNNGTLNFALPSTITVTTGTATITEVIGSGGITKAGTGELLLSGANTYEGLTTVSQGRLRVGNDLALGTSAGATIVTTGGEVLLQDGISIAGETITLSGSGVSHGGALTTTTGASVSWGGGIVLDGTARIGAGSGSVFEITGPIQGSELEVAGAAGDGIVVISGTNNTYTGQTNIVRGFLQLGATNALPVGTVLDVDSSTATENSYFDLHGFDQTVAGLVREGTSGDGNGYITNLGETESTLTISTNDTALIQTYSGVIVDGSAPVAIKKNGAGTLVLSGENDFSGELVLSGNNSSLLVRNNKALGSTVGATAAGGGSRVTLDKGITITGETIRIAGTGGNNFGALQAATDATATWDGKVILNEAGGEARVGANTRGTLIISGPIQDGLGKNLGISATGGTGVNLGIVVISGTNNTYTGATNITRGILKIGAHNALPTGTTMNIDSSGQSSVTDDAIFDLNGFNQTIAGLASSGADAGTNQVLILNNGTAPSTLTLDLPQANTSTYTGLIQDGTGGLSLTKTGAGTLVLAKAQTYTGVTTLSGGTLELRSAAGGLASTSINVSGGGWMVLNNQNPANNNPSRLVDTAQVTLNQGNFSLRGSDSEATTEAVGAFTLASGLSHLKVTHGTSNNATLTATDLVRNDNGGVGFVYGIDLGKDGTSTSGVGRILLDTAPEIIGSTAPLETGRNAGVHDTMIVPYLVGEVDPATGLGSANGTPNTFLTYHATGGLRPLDVETEFATNSQVDGANTRITLTTNFTSGTANSILMAAGQQKLNISGQLVNATGAILFTESADIQGGNLHFGSTEAIITVNSGRTGVIGSAITGSGGMTLTGPGTLGLGGASEYSGGTFVQGGAVLVPQRNSEGEPDQVTKGPFGTGDIVIVDGGMRSSSTSTYTIGNSIKLRGNLNLAGGGNNLNLTGSVGIEGGNRTITNSSASITTFSGAIGDGGNGYGLTLAGSGTGSVVFSGENTYTGPTNVRSGNLVVSGSIAGSTFVGNPASPTSSAVLRGSGTLGNVAGLTSGANIDPGNGVDTTAIMTTGALSLSNGAHLSLQIGGLTAGASVDGHDQIVASGQVSLIGGDLKLSLLGTPAFNSSTTLFLVANNSGLAIDGAFTTLNGLAFDSGNILLGGQQFALVYNANFSGAGSDNIANDLALVAVPEPTSAAMLLAGLATLGFSRAGRRLRRERA